MKLLKYPSIDLNSTFDVLPTDTWRRGISYVQESRVLSCVWDPILHSLFGGVDGNDGRIYMTTVRLSPADSVTWDVESGSCSCPVQLNCEHVAAILIAAAGFRASPMRHRRVVAQSRAKTHRQPRRDWCGG
jgi:uncharacterized Zn finger protein